jgi:hypothetical protein
MTDSSLRYEPVHRIGKPEIEVLLKSDDAADVARALYSATRYEQDWRWIQTECIRRLASSDLSVRWAAATCLGDLAFRRFPLDVGLVIPALEAASREDAIADPALYSLSMVKEFA